MIVPSFNSCVIEELSTVSITEITNKMKTQIIIWLFIFITGTWTEYATLPEQEWWSVSWEYCRYVVNWKDYICVQIYSSQLVSSPAESVRLEIQNNSDYLPDLSSTRHDQGKIIIAITNRKRNKKMRYRRGSTSKKVFEA